MDFIEPNSSFKTFVDFTLSQSDNEVFNLLYYPIIGKDAYVLYNLLFTYGQLKENTFICHEDFCENKNISLSNFINSRNKLESIGLIETLRKEEVVNYENKIYYVYRLYPPATAKKFFKDSILSNLIINSVSEKELNNIKSFFKLSENKFIGYKKISSNFDQMFFSNDNNTNIKEEFKDKKYKSASTVDLVNIEKKLLENEIDIKAIKDYEKTIENYLSLYQIDEEQAVDIIQSSLSTNNEFKEKTFIKKCQNANSYKSNKDAPLVNFNQYLQNEDYQKYTNKSIKEFLTDIFNKSPSNNILSKLDTTFSKFEFSSDIANAILDYVLKKYNGQLNDFVIEKICLSLSYNKVTDLFSAIQCLKRLEYTEEENKLKKERKAEAKKKRNIDESNNKDNNENIDTPLIDMHEFGLDL